MLCCLGFSDERNSFGSSVVLSFFFAFSFLHNRFLHNKRTYMSLKSCVFDNKNLQLPVDLEERNICRQVKDAIFGKVAPTPIDDPILVSISPLALSLLGLPHQRSDYTNELLLEIKEYFSGNAVLPQSPVTYSHCYCGHQFGSFAGQLGDGAAIELGEVMHDNRRWEVQLKGAGKTPFSRSADGRKVLRSSLREYLASEHMFALNIPTTRAASVVTSKTTRVARDPFYDGHVAMEQCAVVSRVAENFFRFGSFEIFKENDARDVGRNANGNASGFREGPSRGNISLKKTLLDHIVNSYYPHLREITTECTDATLDVSDYRRFFDELVQRTAGLVARWQAAGFVHGVLNTDNMSITGLTIDYGPYAFMEQFDPDFTPNGSDSASRYCYRKQPEICKWNLLKLSEVLSPLLPKQDSSLIVNGGDAWMGFDSAYQEQFMGLMRSKLGLLSSRADDSVLVNELFDAMEAASTDFPNTFQAITSFVGEMHFRLTLSEDVFGSSDELTTKLENDLVGISASPSEIRSAVDRSMSIFRLEMHPQQTIQLYDLLAKDPAQVGRLFPGSEFEDVKETILNEKSKLDKLSRLSNKLKLLEALTAESKKDADRKIWKEWIGKYFNRLTEEAADGEGELAAEIRKRLELMQSVNPTFVLRNWVAQKVIAQAEADDFHWVDVALCMCLDPYNQKYSMFPVRTSTGQPCPFTGCSEIELQLVGRNPDWASGLICTCSS